MLQLSFKRSNASSGKKRESIGTKKPMKLPSFSKLAYEQKFDEIGEILRNDKVPHVSWLFSDNCRSDFPMQLFQQQQLPLHTLLKHKPPVSIVELLLETLNEHVSVTRSDMLGRTPLHTAVQYGCGVSVIELLITHSMEGILGMTRDFWGRSPLHWAVAMKENRSKSSLKWSNWMGGKMRRMNNMIDSLETRVMTVYALVQACPDMIYIRDEDGRTPLDLAVDSNADRSLQYLLSPSTSGDRSTSTGYSDSAKHIETNDEIQPESQPELAATASTVFEMTVECSSSEDNTEDASSVGSGGISKFVYPFSKLIGALPPPTMMLMPMPGILSINA